MCCCMVLFLASMLVALHPVQASAQNMIVLFRAAIKNDPQFRGAVYERMAEQEKLQQAYARFWPNLKFESNVTQTDQNVVNSQNQVFVNGSSKYLSTTFGPTVTVPLFRLSLWVQLRQAKNVSQRADVNFAIAREDLILRFARDYVAAQTASDNIAYLKEERKDVRALEERAELRYRSGLGRNTDVSEAKARLASVEADLGKARNEYQDALQVLAAMTGSPVEQVVRFKHELPLVMPNPPHEKEWVKAALENSLQIKSQQMETQIAHQEIWRQRAAYFPTINVVGQFNRNNMGGSLYGGGGTVDTWDVALNFVVPLFDGFTTQSRVRQARDLYMRSVERLDQRKRDAALAVYASFSGVRTAIGRAEALEQSVAAQSEIVSAKELGYKTGAYTSQSVLDAALDLYLYRRDLSLTRYDYIMNTLRLKDAAGSLSEQDLVALNSWLK